MAVTRSWEGRTALHLDNARPPVPPERRRELLWLAGATVIVAAALAHAYFAKTQDFPDLRARLGRGELVNLNTARNPAGLLPALARTGSPEETARKLWTWIEPRRPLPNVGALSRARAVPVASVKPFFVVREPRDYLRQFLLAAALYIASFYAVHLAWRLRRFRGDPAILPALHLLTGLGLALAISLRDPLRDTLEFSKFGWGSAAGCALLLLPLFRFFHYENYARWTYTPLLAALGLFLGLLRFGSGPTGSDARVNLGPFQPVELIKILIVLFLAGYFARRWQWLREVHERRLLPGWLEMPRAAHVLPVLCGVGAALLFFFALKDLGPALVTGFLFLAMFAVARRRAGLAVFGLALLVGGVTLGYRLGTPHTVVDRISMWLSPWENNVHGGDQLAHAEWALATGGALGSGPGWGDPGMIPAGHTDLVLPALGEEWGFAGVAAVLLLFALLFGISLRAALRAPAEYPMFLALGLGSLVALEMALITSGVLGLMPLSGVVSPFLSSGNTAMLANFLIFAVIAGISAQASPRRLMHEPFRAPVRWLAAALAAVALIFTAKAAFIQLLHDRDIMTREALVFEADGVKRPQRNPRLNSLARELTRGSITDRNGIPLASSDWNELERHRAELASLGVDIDRDLPRAAGRYYPFPDATRHLLGDFRTGENFHASNASLIEHDQRAQLQGFSSYAELADAVRFRHQPANPVMIALRARNRSVHTTLDIRLQLRAASVLEKHLAAAHKDRGALLVMNAGSGDVLALATAPAADSLDRARYGQYPPGSTFKLVTAIAALRQDPKLERKTFRCAPLPGGRVGADIPGWNRPIRDDVGDSAHGTLDMLEAITVSCNAYFAQLGVHEVGSRALADTAKLLEIPDADPAELKKMLPFAAYGQGPMLITPFKMARVSAAIARGGTMPQGRWVLEAGNTRTAAPREILDAASAAFLARAMRSVVTGGTGRRAMAGLDIEVAGKTGTAQVGEGAPHSWFTGFAPYDAPSSSRLAFAVVVEHGGYGAQVAAPIARDLVAAARDLGLLSAQSAQR